MSSTTDWFFKPVHISPSRLEEIQIEFKWLFDNYYAEIAKVILDGINGKELPGPAAITTTVAPIISIDKKLVEGHAPSYVDMLHKLNLWQRFHFVIFSGTNNTRMFPPHCDYLKSVGVRSALNIPIQNCHDSYTVWEDVGDSIGNDGTLCGQPGGWFWNRSDVIKEVARVPTIQPHWANIMSPHRPESHHSMLRLILSTRFDPDVVDELHDPIQGPQLLNID